MENLKFNINKYSIPATRSLHIFHALLAFNKIKIDRVKYNW